MKIFQYSKYTWLFGLTMVAIIMSCSPDENNDNRDVLQILQVKVGTNYLSATDTTTETPVDRPIVVTFNYLPDTTGIEGNVIIRNSTGKAVDYAITYLDDYHTLSLMPYQELAHNTVYTINFSEDLAGKDDQVFPVVQYWFKTLQDELKLKSITINEKDFSTGQNLRNINYNHIRLVLRFDHAVDTAGVKKHMNLFGKNKLNLQYTFQDTNTTIIAENTRKLDYYSKYNLIISDALQRADGINFKGYSNQFLTSLDSSLKFPEIPDDQLHTKIQQQTFRYFWDFGHPVSGLARERNTSGETVTSGGSGFGIMAIIVGMERGFISREEGVERLHTMVDFLEEADRFHGVWSHWLNGTTGKVIPFSQKDNGGDLVETSYLIQGLLTFRQYLDSTVSREKVLIDKINNLWHTVEWDWHTKGGEKVLYWHWSPNYGWEKNHKIRGYNEALITYICAASSPTHGIASEVYHEGWAKKGDIQNGNEYYGYELPLGNQAYGGPLFFEHYTYLGVDPRNLSDAYASYRKQGVNHSLINHAYCRDNPKDYVGYSEVCWGLTASDGNSGYSAHSPTNDRGVITPTAAISSIIYTPEESMDAIRHFYYVLGDKLWGEYGFYDAFNPTKAWWASSYLAIDQGPIICMIENYRTGLLWDLFMSAPEVKEGLDKLGFRSE